MVPGGGDICLTLGIDLYGYCGNCSPTYSREEDCKFIKGLNTKKMVYNIKEFDDFIKEKLEELKNRIGGTEAVPIDTSG
ncbi:hypothetical protein C0J52_17928 [Blattella germanica]|nr:hypothetical protein C0J52_17928 [Blattella germanica]